MQSTRNSNRFPSVFLIVGVAMAAVVPAVRVFSTEKRHAPRRVALASSGQRAMDDDIRGGDQGGCCQPSGLCTVETEPACTGLGGVWLGLGTDCTPNCCPVEFPTGSDCACATSTCVVDAGATNTGFVCDPANGNADCEVGQTCTLQCQPSAVTQLRHPYECHDDFGSPLEPPIPCDPALDVALECPPIPCTVDADCAAVLVGTCGLDVPGFCDDTAAMTCELSFTTSFTLTRTDSIDSFFGVLDGDACTLDANSDNVGWYELFELVDPTPGDATDDCFQLTVSHCCTEPARTPVWPFVSRYLDCPCDGPGDVDGIDPDVDQFGIILDGFGPNSRSQFPCDDGNYSGTFMLAPGSYGYQVGSELFCDGSAIPCDTDNDCPGTSCVVPNPDYSVHFTVESCTIGACCLGESCILTNRLDCVAQGGTFLGDGDQPIVTCQPNVCVLGACCVDETCKDDSFSDTLAE